MAATTVTTPTSSLAVEEGPDFIGYYPSIYTFSGVESLSLFTLLAGSGTSWVTSGTFAGDCSYRQEKCIFATGCYGNTMSYDSGSTAKCDDGSSCVTITIYATSPSGYPSASNIRCRAGWLQYTIYRQNPVITTSIGTATSDLPNSSPSSIITSSPSLVSSLSVPTSTSTTTMNGPSPHGGNQAWIAGAVIGPVTGLALAILIIWLLIRRGHQRTRGTEHSQLDIAQSGFGKAELSGSSQPRVDGSEVPAHSELDSRTRSELPG
ncbi:hypothetical protein F5B20DRAFT_501801 [Whalleya microplaca]|nr:hypothetical protein F5B20DRAFT_501801 [Whalleya microplaca]